MFRGDYLNGQFVLPVGETIRSVDPVTGAELAHGTSSAAHVRLAVEGAGGALVGLSRRQAWWRNPLDAFHALFEREGEELARLLHRESGQPLHVVLDELREMGRATRHALLAGPAPFAPEWVARPRGVVGILGSDMLPLATLHTAAVHALTSGNAVVLLPHSSVLASASLYANWIDRAGFPPSTVQIVFGDAEAARALRETERSVFEVRPKTRNVAIVCEDADLRQAVHEIASSAYHRAGHHPAAFGTVLAHVSRFEAVRAALEAMVRALRFGSDESSFAGPLPNESTARAFEQACGELAAREIARGNAANGPFFAPARLYVGDSAAAHASRAIDGPVLVLVPFEDDATAMAMLEGTRDGIRSIFTADEQRFATYFDTLSAYAWTRNRGTRDLPLAVLITPSACQFGYSEPTYLHVQPYGAVRVDPRLEHALVRPDLDRLAASHGREECEEAARDLLHTPRPMSVRRPSGGRLPASKSWLDRLYAGDRVVRDKKAAVFDHLRSAGAWFVSIDEAELGVLDSMSQTATVCDGFAEDAVVRHYVEGGFGTSIVRAPDTAVVQEEYATTFADRLRTLVPGLPHVAFVNSGAEAVEKALALCRLEAPEKRRVIAFEGSFHGRTLLSLSASYNPEKRAPFEFAGYEIAFAPFPVWWSPHEAEPEAPEGYLELVAEGAPAHEFTRFIHGDDAMIASELHSLSQIEAQLAASDVFAVIVEPMQSEGGDRYATSRFFQALRLLTRRYGVSLVFDEVQTGFGLGGTFLWSHRFGLIDRNGQPDVPDCVTMAKRAQVGVVMSRFADPEPTSAHTASIVRGTVRAEMMSVDPYAVELEHEVRERLNDLVRRFPELVLHPRACGYAFAFDLPSAQQLNAYLAQRFWRGAIVFAAGSKTARYRLSRSFDAAELDVLFTAIRRSLAYLEAYPGQMPPEWVDVVDEDKPRFKTRKSLSLGAGSAPPRNSKPTRSSDVPAGRVQVREVQRSERDAIMDRILALEAAVYEPARRDSSERLVIAFEDADGVAVIAEVETDDGPLLVGYALGAPLEHFEDVAGPDRDRMRGMNNTLYSIALTVDPEWSGHGLGARLKRAQIEAARSRQRPDGTPRYRHVSGRNRVGHTQAMMRINRALGAYEVFRLHGQYGDPNAQASYYRLPLRHFEVDPVPGPSAVPGRASIPPSHRAKTTSKPPRLDFASGFSAPFATAPQSLAAALDVGALFGPAVNKITLSNYVTPAIVRAVEWIGALEPRLPHLFLTSSRDEAFDKAVRIFRWHRRTSQVVLGLEGGYVGHTTAAARSLSDPRVHGQGPVHFDRWARVPHPEEDVQTSLSALREAIDAAGGADGVVGIFVEPFQERTGRLLSPEFLSGLDALRRELGVPVAFVETASASYRTGQGAFLTTNAPFVPDALVWWGGGQIGFVHVSARYFVGNPLTFVSTWDGDELSLVRVHHQLRTARLLDVEPAARRLRDMLAPFASAGARVRTCGLAAVVESKEQAHAWAAGMSARGVAVRAYPHGAIGLVPPLDIGAPLLDRFATIVEQVVS